MVKTYKILAITFAAALVSGCVPYTYLTEESSGGGHKKSQPAGKVGGGFWGNIFGASNKGTTRTTDIDKITLLGEKGKWPPYVTQIAKSEIASHPNLVNGIPGKPNPLRGICNNFLNIKSIDQRVDILAKVAMAITYGEGHFGFDGNGGESNPMLLSKGPMQISEGAKRWGCWNKGYKPKNWNASLDCAYKIMDGLYSLKGLPVANNETYWSVLRPNKFLKPRFMTTFNTLSPECSSSYQAVYDKNFPGARIARADGATKNVY